MLVFAMSSGRGQQLTHLVLSKEDKAEIVEQSLQLILSNLGPEAAKEYLALSDEEIGSMIIPEIHGYRFTRVREKEMRRSAPKTVGGLKWLRVAGIEVKGQRVEVVLVPMFMGPGNPPLIRAASHHYLFSKESGKWVDKTTIIVCRTGPKHRVAPALSRTGLILTLPCGNVSITSDKRGELRRLAAT